MEFGTRAILAEHVRRNTRLWLVAVGAALAFAGTGCERDDGVGETIPSPPSAEYVGGRLCAGCHENEAAAWAGSHHDLAMQIADDSTVLADFDNAEFRYAGVRTRFYRRDGGYFVTTDGADGELAEFEVTHAFGVEPLQQYLIELDDGRVQALSIAWDSRSADDGGQRWFHLYPEQAIDHTDALHWTGTYQRWNTMCADCHSTGLVKNYAMEDDRFATEWSSIDVDCEACHGPGSLHAADPEITLPALTGVDRAWVFQPGVAIAARVPAAAQGERAEGPAAEAEVCARCHSRRSQLTDAYAAGDPLLDGFRPELLVEGRYHADGQILDEVYVYGSFLQSAMARAGVVCSDCHDPHSAGLRAVGNGVCARCHLATVFDQPEHHRHEPGTESAWCVSCHMRAETYMVVDPRRDHSFRLPRPDLTDSIGSPNACNDCHANETSAWAASKIAEWYPEGRWNEAHFGQALHAGRSWALDARERLLGLIEDDSEPAIARATAVRLLAERLAEADEVILRRILDDEGELMQLAAIDAVGQLAPDRRIGLIQRFLSDDRLALRTAAARALLPLRAQLGVRRQQDLDAGIGEFLEIQAFNGDRPEGLLNAANVAIDQGRYTAAEAAYRAAIERHPDYAPLYVNLADLYRLLGRPDDSEATLRAGLARSLDDAGIELALAFALVRRQAPDAALPLFRSAADRAADQPYYQYVRAIAENDAGNTGLALELLRLAHEQFPGHGDTLFALTTMLRDAGDIAAARNHAEQLVAVRPGDADALALLRALEQQL